MFTDKVIVEIGGQKFALQFGYACLRTLGARWNCDGIQGIVQRMAGLQFDGDEISFKTIDTLADVILAGIESEDSNASHELTLNDVCNYMLGNAEKVMEIMQAFVAALPKPKEPVNPGKRLPANARRK